MDSNEREELRVRKIHRRTKPAVPRFDFTRKSLTPYEQEILLQQKNVKKQSEEAIRRSQRLREFIATKRRQRENDELEKRRKMEAEQEHLKEKLDLLAKKSRRAVMSAKVMPKRKKSKKRPLPGSKASTLGSIEKVFLGPTVSESSSQRPTSAQSSNLNTDQINRIATLGSVEKLMKPKKQFLPKRSRPKTISNLKVTQPLRAVKKTVTKPLTVHETKALLVNSTAVDKDIEGMIKILEFSSNMLLHKDRKPTSEEKNVLETNLKFVVKMMEHKSEEYTKRGEKQLTERISSLIPIARNFLSKLAVKTKSEPLGLKFRDIVQNPERSNTSQNYFKENILPKQQFDNDFLSSGASSRELTNIELYRLKAENDSHTLKNLLRYENSNLSLKSEKQTSISSLAGTTMSSKSTESSVPINGLEMKSSESNANVTLNFSGSPPSVPQDEMFLESLSRGRNKDEEECNASRQSSSKDLMSTSTYTQEKEPEVKELDTDYNNIETEFLLHLKVSEGLVETEGQLNKMMMVREQKRLNEEKAIVDKPNPVLELRDQVKRIESFIQTQSQKTKKTAQECHSNVLNSENDYSSFQRETNTSSPEQLVDDKKIIGDEVEHIITKSLSFSSEEENEAENLTSHEQEEDIDFSVTEDDQHGLLEENGSEGTQETKMVEEIDSTASAAQSNSSLLEKDEPTVDQPMSASAGSIEESLEDLDFSASPPKERRGSIQSANHKSISVSRQETFFHMQSQLKKKDLEDQLQKNLSDVTHSSFSFAHHKKSPNADEQRSPETANTSFLDRISARSNSFASTPSLEEETQTRSIYERSDSGMETASSVFENDSLQHEDLTEKAANDHEVLETSIEVKAEEISKELDSKMILLEKLRQHKLKVDRMKKLERARILKRKLLDVDEEIESIQNYLLEQQTSAANLAVTGEQDDEVEAELSSLEDLAVDSFASSLPTPLVDCDINALEKEQIREEEDPGESEEVNEFMSKFMDDLLSKAVQLVFSSKSNKIFRNDELKKIAEVLSTAQESTLTKGDRTESEEDYFETQRDLPTSTPPAQKELEQPSEHIIQQEHKVINEASACPQSISFDTEVTDQEEFTHDGIKDEHQSLSIEVTKADKQETQVDLDNTEGDIEKMKQAADMACELVDNVVNETLDEVVCSEGVADETQEIEFDLNTLCINYIDEIFDHISTEKGESFILSDADFIDIEVRNQRPEEEQIYLKIIFDVVSNLIKSEQSRYNVENPTGQQLSIKDFLKQMAPRKNLEKLRLACIERIQKNIDFSSNLYELAVENEADIAENIEKQALLGNENYLTGLVDEITKDIVSNTVAEGLEAYSVHSV